MAGWRCIREKEEEVHPPDEAAEEAEETEWAPISAVSMISEVTAVDEAGGESLGAETEVKPRCANYANLTKAQKRRARARDNDTKWLGVGGHAKDRKGGCKMRRMRWLGSLTNDDERGLFDPDI